MGGGVGRNSIFSNSEVAERLTGLEMLTSISAELTPKGDKYLLVQEPNSFTFGSLLCSFLCGYLCLGQKSGSLPSSSRPLI